LYEKQNKDLAKCLKNYYPGENEELQQQAENNSKSQKQQQQQKEADKNDDASKYNSITAHLSLSIKHSEFLELLKPFIAQQRLQHSKNSSEDAQRILMIGLHTCGNLSATIMKLFLGTESNALINAGCCYHKLTEDTNYLCQSEAPEDHCGYPLSKNFYKTKLPLSSGKYLAAGYTPNNEELEVLKYNYKMQSYRTVLEQLLFELVTPEDGMPESHHVGQCPESCSVSFAKYACHLLKKMLSKPCTFRQASYKHRMETIINELLQREPQALAEYLNNYYQKHNPSQQPFIPGVAIYAVLRLVLSSVVESVILTDRVLYLREQPNVKSAHLVRVFDPRISPRSIVLVAHKK